jgi:hypothetical protein
MPEVEIDTLVTVRVGAYSASGASTDEALQVVLDQVRSDLADSRRRTDMLQTLVQLVQDAKKGNNADAPKADP